MMLPVKRALLIINRTAGTGQGKSIAEKLSLLFKQGLHELSDVQINLVSNHAAAHACAADFLRKSEAPALVVAGGGGGTLRAVIEAICDSRTSAELPGPEHVRIGALRMGSGNVLAKHVGVPPDPFLGLQHLLMNLKAGHVMPCCVMRCKTWTRSDNSQVHHAVTLGGLGQFGRIPSDLARWHARFPIVHRYAAQWLGIEQLTNVEYALSLLIRSIFCTLFPDLAETVEIQFQDHKERFRLLSGLIMNFPIDSLPVQPGVTVQDEALAVYLIPYTGRCSPLRQIASPQRLIPHSHRMRIEKNQRLEVRFVDRECVEFFLDEDPVTTCGRLSIEVAGSVAFVPGADHQQLSEAGVSS